MGCRRFFQSRLKRASYGRSSRSTSSEIHPHNCLKIDRRTLISWHLPILWRHRAAIPSLSSRADARDLLFARAYSRFLAPLGMTKAWQLTCTAEAVMLDGLTANL